MIFFTLCVLRYKIEQGYLARRREAENELDANFYDSHREARDKIIVGASGLNFIAANKNESFSIISESEIASTLFQFHHFVRSRMPNVLDWSYILCAFLAESEKICSAPVTPSEEEEKNNIASFGETQVDPFTRNNRHPVCHNETF